MAFLLNFVGLIVFIAGLGWLATALGVSQAYVLGGAAILLALGVFTALVQGRGRETP